MTALAAYLPSPDQGVWHLGPVPIRAYALCILLGIAAAIVIGERRWVAGGGEPGAVADVAAWAVPFGIVGSRIYHLLTSPQAYFGDGGRPLNALKIWEGGLGIWGAIAGGAVGAYIACRRRGWSFVRFADALAPGLAVGQAIGRFGNWFNQELFGRPTTVPWALEISPEHRPQGYEAFGTYHPTFLYESLWCVFVALVIVLAGRRYTLDRGRSFALYVALYTLGRGFFEYLRIDPANQIFGLRVNVWTSLVLGCSALVLFAVAQQRARRSASHHADDVPTIQDAQAPRNVG